MILKTDINSLSVPTYQNKVFISCPIRTYEELRTSVGAKLRVHGFTVFLLTCIMIAAY